MDPDTIDLDPGDADRLDNFLERTRFTVAATDWWSGLGNSFRYVLHAAVIDSDAASMLGNIPEARIQSFIPVFLQMLRERLRSTVNHRYPQTREEFASVVNDFLRELLHRMADSPTLCRPWQLDFIEHCSDYTVEVTENRSGLFRYCVYTDSGDFRVDGHLRSTSGAVSALHGGRNSFYLVPVILDAVQRLNARQTVPANTQPTEEEIIEAFRDSADVSWWWRPADQEPLPAAAAVVADVPPIRDLPDNFPLRNWLLYGFAGLTADETETLRRWWGNRPTDAVDPEYAAAVEAFRARLSLLVGDAPRGRELIQTSETVSLPLPTEGRSRRGHIFYVRGGNVRLVAASLLDAAIEEIGRLQEQLQSTCPPETPARPNTARHSSATGLRRLYHQPPAAEPDPINKEPPC